MTTRVSLYARVSTDMQAEEGHSLDAQIHEMREFAAARQWQVVAEWQDAGASGSSMNRPGLQALLQAVRQRETDVILVHETSRLSRSIFDTFRIFETLGEHTVGFASVKELDFDFSTPSGRFFLTMISAMNQYYLDLLKQHTAKGKRERAKKGLYNASVLPYGYKATEGSRNPPEILEKEAAAVRLAFESYATGNASFQETADILNNAGYRTRTGRRFSKDTVDDMLKNPFYKGKVLYGGGRRDKKPEEFEGQHQAIVKAALFDACQEAREKRRGHLRAYQSHYETYLLNAISHCSVCERSLRAHKTITGRYYRELSRQRGFVNCPNAQKGVRAEIPEAQMEAIIRHLKLPESWRQEVEALLARDEDDRETLKSRRARLKAEKRRMLEAYIRGEFEGNMDPYNLNMARVKRELDAIPETDLQAIEEAAEALAQIGEVWDEADMEEKRDLIRLIFHRLEIDVQQQRLAALYPFAAFLPLLRHSSHLLEIETGKFIPLWPPDEEKEHEAAPILPTLKAHPLPQAKETPVWPQIIALPRPPAGQRISPVLSKFLQARRKAGNPAEELLDAAPSACAPLRLDKRKWPEVSLSRYPLLPGQEARLYHSAQSVSFLRSAFLLQDAPQAELWMAEIRRVLETGGWWILLERMPVSMPGHWLYRYYPHLPALERESTQTPSEMYVALREQGFKVTMTQQTWYQAVTYGALRAMLARGREGVVLQKLSEADYLAGLKRVEADCGKYGEDALLASQVCVAEIRAEKMA